MLGARRRIALLAEGHFAPMDAKTAVGVLRYRPDEVVCVIDSTRAGRTAAECVGVGGDRPVVADVESAAARGADTLLVGIAPQGGGLPDDWRSPIASALARGWDVLAGLHAFLGDDPEFAALAAANGARILDVRRPPARRPIAARRATRCGALVVLTVGSDCNVGKMTAALEVQAELRRRGVRAAFVATGQTGIFVADEGVAVDAVVSDFVAGVTEDLVLAAARDADVVLVEGQGTLFHPGYSGVSLALLHGACPEALILCHEAGRTLLRAADDAEPLPIRPLAELVAEHERVAGWMRPARVLGVALNTRALAEDEARRAVAGAGRATSLPATDPVRFGAAPLADAVRRALEERAIRAPGR
ncbi:MAG: DUF1611 domain-containing protein [Candidatus Eisenbacteria bacterium]|nr:DUF1611 domain-containing protein [Candidatus Eisenbacteria bacterium]